MSARGWVISLMWTAAASMASATPPSLPALSCDPARIEPESYRLVLGAGAGPNLLPAAQRALLLDPANALAQATLAREYLVLEQPGVAEAAWQAVIDGGGTVAWTATLYDVDVRSYFFMTFSRADLRIYRFSQMAGDFKQGSGGIPKFPGLEDKRFWAAYAGCVPADARPEAVVPWSEVREIRAGNWVLYFELKAPVRVSSDRGKDKKLTEIKVALHGPGGDLQEYQEPDKDDPSYRSRGPWSYQELVRRTLVKFVDPQHRIALPASKPGAGW